MQSNVCYSAQSSADEGEFWPSVGTARALEGAQRDGEAERERVPKNALREGRMSRWEVTDGLPPPALGLVQQRMDLPLDNRSQSNEATSTHALPIKAGVKEACDSPASWHTHCPQTVSWASSPASRDESNLRVDLELFNSKFTKVDRPLQACDDLLQIIEDGDEVSLNQRTVIVTESEQLAGLYFCSPHAAENALNASVQQFNKNKLAHAAKACIDATEMVYTPNSSLAPYLSCSLGLETINEDEGELMFGPQDMVMDPLVGSAVHMNIPSIQINVLEKTERMNLVSGSLPKPPGDCRGKKSEIGQSEDDAGRSHGAERPLSRAAGSSVKPDSHVRERSPKVPPDFKERSSDATCGDEGLDAFLSDPNVSPDAKIKQLLVRLKALENKEDENGWPEHSHMPAGQLRLESNHQQQAMEEVQI